MRKFARLIALSWLLAPAVASATVHSGTINGDVAQATTCSVGSTTQAVGTVTYDDVSRLFSWSYTYGDNASDFDNGALFGGGGETISHFHGPAAPGVPAGVQVGTGTGTPNSESTTISVGQGSDLLDELWYLNIHSSSCAGGEIRGQVLFPPVNSVILNLSRLDDFVFPAAGFGMDMTVELNGAVGVVTAVSVVAGSLALTFEEFAPGSGEWDQAEEVTFSNLAELKSDLDGTWTLAIEGASPSTSTFALDATALVDGDFFATPTNLSPANGATGVSPTTLLSWTDPTGMVTPYALAVDVENDSGTQEVLSIPDLGVVEIPITATSWQPPLALANGPVEFAVFYADVDLAVATAISALQVTAGTITWGNSSFAPPGYPAATPLLLLSSESIVQFAVPEPSAALLAATALAGLALLARCRSRALGRSGSV